MRVLLLSLASLFLGVSAASGQALVNGVPPLSKEAAQRIADLESRIPVPADTTPRAEMPGGTAGTTNTFRRGDAAAPRLTRVGTFTVTGLAGLIVGTWEMPLPAGAPDYPMFFSGIGAQNTPGLKCKVIASTNIGFTAQCQQDLITLVGITGGPTIYAPPGTQVFCLSIPSTQAPRS